VNASRISPWRTIGGVVKITHIYTKVREYGISSRQGTDADEHSRGASGPSGFLLPGTIVQIFSNVSLRTSSNLSIISSMDQPSGFSFAVSVDILTWAASWYSKDCISGPSLIVHRHLITHHVHSNHPFLLLDDFEAA
jgi:hypothetical protein